MFRKNNPHEGSYLPNVETRLEHRPEGQSIKHIGSSFYRGENCNFNPYKSDYEKDDFLELFLLKGWLPQSRFLNADTKITAFGSCFARNFSNHLGTIGYNTSKDRAPDVYISTMGEGLVNVYALLQQFEWAFENITPPENLWHGYNTEEFGRDEIVRQKTRDVFMDTDFFIITLSISEVWYDSVSGGVLWRAVPQDRFDDNRHKFRVCSFDETKAALNRMYQLIKKHVPKAKLLFTLSPIPLAATFRAQSCVSANSASKAILRAALDEFYREHTDELNKNVFYFPSFEMVIDLFPSRFSEDMRHTYPEITDFTMKIFESIYCQTNTTIEDVNILYKEVRKITNQRLIEL